MSLADNKKLVMEFFATIAKGDVRSMGRLMTADATWWVAPSTKFSGLYKKSAFLAIVPGLFEQAAGPLSFRFDEVIAEEDRVSVTAKGNLPMKSGKTYQSDYHFNYFGVNGNIASLKRFVHQVRRSWYKWLNRRSQRPRLDWARFEDLLEDLPLPTARIVVPIWR